MEIDLKELRVAAKARKKLKVQYYASYGYVGGSRPMYCTIDAEDLEDALDDNNADAHFGVEQAVVDFIENACREHFNDHCEIGAESIEIR